MQYNINIFVQLPQSLTSLFLSFFFLVGGGGWYSGADPENPERGGRRN